MYSHLVWEDSVDAQVPVHAEERLDAPLPVPVSGFIEALRNPRKNLPHDLLHPPAACMSKREGSSAPATHLIRIMISAFMKASTLARLFLW